MEILYFNELDSTQIKDLESGNFPENKIEQYLEKVEKFKKLCGGQLGLTLDKKESYIIEKGVPLLFAISTPPYITAKKLHYIFL